MHLTDLLKHLNETKRNAIAHDLGVGITHLVMQAAGYAWAGLAEDHIIPSVANNHANGKCPDLIFDQGTWSSEYAAVEAKGSAALRAISGSRNMEMRLRKACRDQVSNVLGATAFDGTPITRGLSVGLQGWPGGDAAVFGCIEADPRSNAPPSLPFRPLSAFAAMSGGFSPMRRIALRHYNGVMKLIGAAHFADQLLRPLLKTSSEALPPPSDDEIVPREEFVVRYFRGEPFVLSHWETYPEQLTPMGPHKRFAVSLHVVDLLDRLFLSERPEYEDVRINLPLDAIRPLYLETLEQESESFVDYDGLAVLCVNELDDKGGHQISL